MGAKLDSPEDLALAERAAAWVAAMQQGENAPHAQFAVWLKESPRHVEEALFAAVVAQELQQFDRERAIDIKALIAEAGSKVVPLVHRPAFKLEGLRDRGKRWIGWAAAVMAIAGTTLGAWWQTGGPGSWQRYATSTGEQRTVELADGSLVYLNTRSQISVRLDEGSREIRLLDGEALFKVEHDATRPFRVHADRAVIQAIGTQFAVYRQGAETRVSVLEGRVRISTAESAPRDSSAGEGANISARGLIVPQAKIDPIRATAWRQRRLIFQADTLEDIANEFNRYNAAPKIRIEGSDVRQARFTGVFDADDPQSLGLLLGKDKQLAFERNGDELVIRNRVSH